MKKFSDLCAERFSVRSYQSTPVPEEALGYICECVRMAPSAVNRQPWKFIVVRTPELRKQLQTCYGREWFAEAPVYVVACRLAAEEWVRPADHKPHGDIDVAIAVEHLCLAATEQGLGTCWVCNFDVARCKEALGLPEGVEPVAIVPIGYPADNATIVKKRKPAAEIWEER